MGNTTLPIANGFYVSDSLPISGQRAINCYPNIPQSDTVTDANIFGTPGLNQLLTVSGIDSGRGRWEVAGIPFFVIGNKLYRLNRSIDGFDVETFTTDDLGTILGSGPVKMSDNGAELAIVAPGTEAYILDVTTDALTVLSGVANFNGPADSVVYIDGFFVFTKTDSDVFFNSNLDDGLTYSALDFSTADADPDNIIGQIVSGSRLYQLGTQTTQTFRNIARDPEPFQNVNGATYDKGLDAPFSLIKDSSTFVMVGSGERESPAIWKFTGNGYGKISTTAIDNLLAKLTDAEVSAITAWSYSEAGAFFIGFQFPDTCLVYDEANKRWHERQSRQGSETTTYRVAGMVEAYGRVLVDDVIDGRIGELDREVYKEYGGPLVRTIITKPFDNLGKETSIGEIEAVMETGVGVTGETVTIGGVETPANVDPQLRLSRSTNGGRTYGPELARGLGRSGDYNRRVIWRRWGDFSRSDVLQFEYSEPAKFVFIKLEADVD